MDTAAPVPSRVNGRLFALIAAVSVVVVGFAVLAVFRGSLFSSENTPSIAEAYAGRVDVGVYPLPGLAPADAASLQADPYFVANALLVATATADLDAAESTNSQLITDLRSQLIAAWDPETNDWPLSQLPQEVTTAAAVQALSSSGNWPDEIDATSLLGQSSATLSSYLATSDSSNPLLAADLLPWVTTTMALSNVSPNEATQLLTTIPVDQACTAALQGGEVDGLVLNPALLTATEVALATGNEACSNQLTSGIKVTASALRGALGGSDAIYHLRAVHDLAELGVLNAADAESLRAAGLEALAALPNSELVTKVEDLAGLVQAGIAPLPVSTNFGQTVLRPYSQGRLTTGSERNAGLYLLLDGILGTFDSASQQELRGWVEPLSPELTLQEQLVVAALGLGELPSALPEATELDGTSEVALLLAAARFDDQVCPLLANWPELPTGVFAVAVRWRAIDCGADVEPLGPQISTFVTDIIATRPWVPEDSVVSAIQLTRAVMVDCLGDRTIESTEALTAALTEADTILGQANPAGTNEFSDWSRAIAVAYGTDGCDAVSSSLLGAGS